jgi:HD superfamily phosphohydrolase
MNFSSDAHYNSQTYKTYNDPIHGHIEIPFYANEIIDTPQFQRLRDLKQLGCSYLVYPGASHNRFEHSIGVGYLAGKLLQKIKETQPELEINSRDLKIIKLAGLCHDLGHGPFSHAFEVWLDTRGIHFHHEEMSTLMLDHLIDDNAIDINRDDVRFIQDLILSRDAETAKYKERRFLFDIVANKRNSVDVDKFDYLARDTYTTGIKSSYDFSRLLLSCRVIQNEICWHAKEVYNVYEMFHTRYTMFKKVYTHRVGKAIEYMVGDAFNAANGVMKITDKLTDPKRYSTLTDSILRQIEVSEDPELAEAQKIIRRIRKRELYKFADEFIIPPLSVEHFTKDRITPAKIVPYSDSSDVELREEDIIVDRFVINYAFKDKNPVDHVHFFSKWDADNHFTIPKDQVSLLIPSQFAEHYIRIYVKDPTKSSAAQKAFRNFLKTVYHDTPSPQHLMPDSKTQLQFAEKKSPSKAAKQLQY